MRSMWSRLRVSLLQTFPSRRLPRKTRLRLERLEDRLTLSTMVSLDASGNLVIVDADGGSSSDSITLRSDTANSQFVISDPVNTFATDITGASGSGTNEVLVPFASVTGSQIAVNTLAGDDTLTVDLGLGNFAKSITYDGGTQGSGGDGLVLQGGATVATVTHTFTSSSAGTVAISGSALITYSGVEPVIDNLSAADRVFAYTGGAETITLFPAVGSSFDFAIGSSAGALVRFDAPIDSLTIDAGTGDDTVNVNGAVGTFPASLTINGGLGHDTINLNSDINFAANRNLEVDLQNDDARNPGVDRISVAENANLVFADTGTATLKASSGISFAAGSSLITADGVLILEGNGPGTGDANFAGIALNGATIQSTGSGAVQMLGRGGVGGTNNHGVRLTNGAVIQAGTGHIQVNGTGGVSSGSPNPGVALEGAGTAIRSTGGNIQVTGTGGGSGSSSGNSGVVMRSAQIIAGGTGTVTVLGTAGTTSGGPNRGVELAASTITSSGGNVQVTGVGGAVPGTNGTNVGVYVNIGSRISAGGAGNVTVHGTGSLAGGIDNHGVLVTGADSKITSGGGDIQVTGIRGAQSITTPSFGVLVTASGSIVSTSAANIELISDSLGIAAPIDGGSNTVTLRQLTHGMAITLNVADAAGVLGLTDAELDLVTAGTLNIGDVNSGVLTVWNTVSRAAPTVMNLTSGSDIVLNGLIFDPSAVVTLSSPAGSIITPPNASAAAPDVRAATVDVVGTVAPGGSSAGELAVDGSLVFSSGDRYVAQLNGATAYSQYDVISATGTVNLGAAILEVLPTFTPSVGQLFTIVNSSGGVLGLFRDTNGNPLAEGATFNANGITFSITYQGGSDGRDVVLRAQTTGITIFISDASVVETSAGTTTISFNVNLSAPGNQTIAVNYATENGTATTADGDYIAKSGTVGFNVGDTSEQVTITVNGDAKFEANETFTVYLSNPVGATIGDGQGIGTIVNDDAQPAISVSAMPNLPEGGAPGPIRAEFTVTLSNPSYQTVTFNYATGGGTATGGRDYTSVSGVAAFMPGQMSQVISVWIEADNVYEPNETFNFNLTSATNATIAAPGGFTATIIDDDPVPLVTIGNFSGLERDPGSATSFHFQAALSNPSYQPITVNYATADGTAVAGSDYTATSGTVTFAPGETVQSITVAITPDRNYEPDETFSVILSSPTNANLGSSATGTGTIRNDDALPTISINDLTIAEGDSGGAKHFFTVSLSSSSTETVSVGFAIANGTAQFSDNDFEPGSGTVTFAPGQTTQVVGVLILGDAKFEANETFTVNLSNPSNATILDGQGVGTITNDDAPPAVSLSLSGNPLAESGGGATVSATLSAISGQPVTVNLGFTGTATNLADYTRSGTAIVIPAGSTTGSIVLTGVNDSLDEANETVIVDITSVTNATEAGTQQVTATIVDDDAPPTVSLSLASGWSLETVDSAGDVGAWSSLKIGSDNKPRIAYEDRSTSSRNLKYASFDGASWNLQTVHDDPTDIVGQEASLALDSLNRPHIAYQNFSDSRLLYAHHNGTSWVLETANANSYLQNSLALDSQDRPLVSSYNSNTFDLNLARRIGGTWSVETPDGTNDATGFHTSLAVDSADNPWITFVNSTDQTLTLARHDGAAWSFQTIDSGSSFRDSSLVLDSLGRPHVSYYDFGTNGAKQDLKYAFFDGAAWNITTVDSNNAGEHNSLALDSLDRPRIAYIGSGAARFASFDGNAWTTQFVGPQANYTSLALDQNDLASISYYSTTSGDLVLATQMAGSTLAENGGVTTVTATLSTASGQTVTVDLGFSGSATPSSDYSSSAPKIVIPAGSTTGSITLTGVDDSTDESNETIVVDIVGVTNGTEAGTQQVTATITDDDLPPSLSINDVTLTEGNAGFVIATFTVTLSQASGQTVTVNADTADDSAVAPDDYTSASPTLLSFAPGQTTQTFTVPIQGDLLDEINETFFVNLSGPSNATISDGQGIATITDDDAPPTLSITDATVTEGNAGTANGTFTVSLSQASGHVVTVNIATADGSAVAPGDYLSISSTLISFAPGQTTQTFTVNIQGDALDELDEAFFVQLGNPSNATISDGQGIVTIIDDDLPPTLSINDVTVSEGNAGTATATFTVSLSQPSGQTITVDAVTADGSAAAPGDYISASSTLLSFAPGQTTQTFTVQIQGDLLDEINETFFVNLSGPSNATISDGQGIATITDDDAPPTLSITDATVTEGNAGTVDATFTVSLSQASGHVVTVNIATADGSAVAPGDYISASPTLISFAPGQTTQTFTVQVQGDLLDEINEAFFVNLSGPSNATISDGQGIATITDDDAPPTLSITDATVTEGNAGTVDATFTVSLSQASGQTITVDAVTTDGSAVAPGDYISASPTLISFAPGQTTQTFTVQVQGDLLDEVNEMCFVNLANPSNATLSDGQGVVTIIDDDVAPTMSINDVAVSEGNAGTAIATFTVSLSQASGQTITVDAVTADGSAVAPGDYISASPTLISFAPGQTTQTFTVQVQGDVLDEVNEMFFVNLANPSNATLSDGQGVVTITDDDVAPTMSINDVAVSEGNAGTAIATFTVSLSQASGQTVTVNVATVDGTAIAPGDYTSLSSTQVSFAPGETTAQVQVTVFGDLLNEPGEDFFVDLADPVNAALGDGRAVGTIVTDDFLPVAAAGPDQTAEVKDLLSFDGAASSDANGDPLTYSWNFGDGSADVVGQVVSHAYASAGSFTVTLAVTDGHGGSSTDTLVVTVASAPPTASLNGPSDGVRGQARFFTVAVAGEPTVATTIDWGDGTTPRLLAGPQDVSLSHVYTGAGSYTVTLTASNPDGSTTVRSHDLTIAIAQMQGTTLVVGGTTASDVISVEPTNAAGTSIRAIVNGTAFGPFTPDTLVVYGQAGADSLVLESITSGNGKRRTTRYVNVPATLFGDAGADVLDASGSNVDNVLSGGDGDDQLFGGAARDLLFGGLGADTLRGRNGDDLMVGNSTVFDNGQVALNALRAEWTRSDLSYASRIDHLLGRTAGGLNGGYVFNRTTVLGEASVDQLYGEGNQDWFIVLESEANRDSIRDRKKNETITQL